MVSTSSFAVERGEIVISDLTMGNVTLPNDKILAWSNLKGFSDDKLNVVKIIISVFHRVETLGKRRKC